jgi:hypothetical protein
MEGTMMNTPEWLKPGLVGAVAGGVIVAIGGFTLEGWMTEGNANQMARDLASESVVAAFVPICVERAENDPERIAKLATIRQATTAVRQRDALLAAGWAEIPGDAAASRNLATACLAALDLPAA